MLEGKHYVVLGASSGIGRATAGRIAEAGGRVTLVARREAVLCEVRAAMQGSHHEVSACDISEPDALIDVIKAAAKLSGPIAGVVHSVGVHRAVPIRFTKPEGVRKAFEVNVFSAFELLRAVRQKDVCGPGASVVLLSSVLGIVGQAGAALYSSTKGALITLARSAALELAPDNIRVNCVAPGVVETEMTESFRENLTEAQFAAIVSQHPLGIGLPDDVAHAIVFLLSDKSRWITGSVLTVDGGYTAQ